MNPADAVDTYAYDAAGRMTSRTVDSVTTALGWDPLSNLTSTSTPADSRIYAYDASGQRVAQIVVNAVAPGAVASKVTAYIGDLEVTDADGLANTSGLSATRFLTFGGATVATVTSGSPAPTWSLMLGDGQGSAQVAMKLVPQASGTGLELASASHTVTRNAYMPFGATRGGDNLATSRGWLGQVADTDTGLIYLNARYYDPVLARFVSPDPLMNPGDPKTLDPYRYADNNPVMATDASGLAACYGLKAEAEAHCMWAWSNGTYGHRWDTSGAKKSGGGKGPDNRGKSPWEPVLQLLFANDIVVGSALQTGFSCSDMDCVYDFMDYGPCMEGQGKNCWAPQLGTADCLLCWLQGALDVASLFPVIGPFADLANASIYAAKGDWLNMSVSLIGTAPVIGDAGVVARIAKKTVNGIDNATDAAKIAGKCSFEGDTKVLMADGSTKPIGDIEPGDRVMAEDPETGKRGPRTVTHVWVHGDDLVDFRIADDVVTTTEDHPFWNATDRQWEGPEEFDAGDRVLTADGNLLVTRGLVPDSWHTGTAYNLTVNDIHTFYVVVADEAVLVHNVGCEKWAKAFASKNGGDVVRIETPGTKYLGGYRPGGSLVDEFWGHHEVVVRDGKVFDQWHPEGIGIDEFKSLWDNGDVIDFGF